MIRERLWFEGKFRSAWTAEKNSRLQLEQDDDTRNILFLFIISLHRLNKFLQYLTEAGFRVSRTHYDPTGVRTDATLEQFKSVLTKYSVPTYTNAGTTQTNTEKTV